MRGWLRELRNRAEKTQTEVAAAAGISQSHYSEIESETARPSVEVARKIASVLKFNWTKFYDCDRDTG
ncbi:helix-turn-helix transcriptional regulator [Cohnella cellulosilytica]|uniref:Helix-turn-helix transcriptional regulator n=1 Tax=Cohnella cellulosilytica TaxID=986710 RepID=A0ABW2FJJ1_9BACL